MMLQSTNSIHHWPTFIVHWNQFPPTTFTFFVCFIYSSVTLGVKIISKIPYALQLFIFSSSTTILAYSINLGWQSFYNSTRKSSLFLNYLLGFLIDFFLGPHLMFTIVLTVFIYEYMLSHLDSYDRGTLRILRKGSKEVLISHDNHYCFSVFANRRANFLSVIWFSYQVFEKKRLISWGFFNADHFLFCYC